MRATSSEDGASEAKARAAAAAEKVAADEAARRARPSSAPRAIVPSDCGARFALAGLGGGV
jgi:hypothetical protein